MEFGNTSPDLPRSVRWRIDLNLLRMHDACDGQNRTDGPSSILNPNDCVGTCSDTDASATIESGIGKGEATRAHRNAKDGDNILEQLELQNEQLISQHRHRYDSLFDKHYKNSSAIEIIHDSEQHTNAEHNLKGSNSNIHPKTSGPSNTQKRSTSASGGDSGTSTALTPGGGASAASHIEDPLSVFAQIEEQKVKTEKEKEMELKKERALAARTQYSAAHHYHSHHESKKKVSKMQESPANESVGTRWSEFYSSRDTMDIIEKDVDRLPIDHQVVAFYTKRTKQNASSADPGVPTFELENELKRMHQGSEDNDAHDETMKECRRERSMFISHILFVYAKEYPIIGYRQGMHEILSLVFLCLEIDLLAKKEEEQNHHNLPAEQKSHGATHSLLDSSKIANDSFIIFEAIMALLSPAFEVRDLHHKTTSSSSPMELIGIATVDKIRILARDEELYQFITSISIPPELYCTRWIRLMFSREVKGLNNVMKLWDTFFQLITSVSSKTTEVQEDSNGGCNDNLLKNNLMNILETTAASMIFMLRDELIPPPTLQQRQMQYMGMQSGGQEEDERDPNDCIHLLMNYPPIEDVSKLVKLTEEMIYGKFNLASYSTSPQIIMNDEMNLNIQNQNAHYNNFPQHQMDNCNQQNIISHSPMDHNMNMYGFGPQNGNEVDPMAYAPNHSYDSPYFNQQHLYTPNQMQHNSYPQQGKIEPIRSTIENIAGKEAWKKLSGGLSEGLNAFKGALGSLDHTLQHLTIANENKSHSSYQQGSQPSHSQIDNVYNPGYRNTDHLYDQGFMTGNERSNGQHLIVDGQVVKQEGGNMMGQESIYNPAYRDLSNVPGQDFETNVMSQPKGNSGEHQTQITDSTQKQKFEAVAPVDNPLNAPSSEGNENIVIGTEDQFVGDGVTHDSNEDESQHLAKRLDSSLLKLSAYIQTQMMQTGGSNHIPQSVWDAMADIEAVKRELTTIYNVSIKEI